MTGAFAVLLLLLQDPAEEDETRAAFHLRAGAFLEKDPDSLTDALYRYERVFDACRATNDERIEARRRLHRLHERIPPNADEAKAGRWRVLALLPRNVNYRTADQKVCRYRVTDATARNVQKGFEAFQRAVWESTRGMVKIDGKVVSLEEEVRSLTPADAGVWLHPDDLERNRLARLKDGDFDLVLVYLLVAEGLPVDRQLRAEPNFRGMLYANFLWSAQAAESNSGVGGWEFLVWLWDAVQLVRRRAGLPDVVWAPDANQMRNDACYGGPKVEGADEIPWRRHYAEDHFTSQMWREVVCRPQAPFIRTWLLSPRFENREDRGLSAELVAEGSDDLDLRGWELAQSRTDVVDLLAHAKGNPRGIYYAATHVYSKKRQWVKLFLGEDASAKVLLNGQTVHFEHEHRGLEADRHCIRMPLREGRNLLVVKVENNADQWRFCARITDLYGQPVKVEVTPVRK
ncbi:MAG: hypothetical protein HYY17_11045 [Planctomycetes bacterium]|nr:hypothetical protein [Planctomycetota bacterium]